MYELELKLKVKSVGQPFESQYGKFYPVYVYDSDEKYSFPVYTTFECEPNKYIALKAKSFKGKFSKLVPVGQID